MTDMNAGGKVFAAVAYKAKPGKRDALIKAIKDGDIENRFRKQPGCLMFQYAASIDDEDTLCLFDIWESVADFTAHTTCDVVPDFAKLKEEYVADTQANIYKDE